MHRRQCIQVFRVASTELNYSESQTATIFLQLTSFKIELYRIENNIFSI